MEKLCRDKHVNIIDVITHGQLRPAYYFIDMELCDLNLDEYLDGRITGVYGLLDWAKAKQDHGKFLIVAIMQQLLSGLIFIHEHDEVHRDLNPHNGNATVPSIKFTSSLIFSKEWVVENCRFRSYFHRNVMRAQNDI